MIECVVNVSEGRDPRLVAAIADRAGIDLLDVHSDAHHNRSVLTIVGATAPRAVASASVSVLDIRTHRGVHPRIGVVDVVPFVALDGSSFQDALAERDRFAEWAAEELGVPSFLYGPDRSLPELRRGAFTRFPPDVGPSSPHPTAGAMAVGARQPLIAYNVWLATADLELAKRTASAVRCRSIRALGLRVGDRVQVSMNLVEPGVVGPAEATDAVAALTPIDGCELVGLLPDEVLHRTPRERWDELDLAADRTVEARLEIRRARLQTP